jgi:hypothetical protein
LYLPCWMLQLWTAVKHVVIERCMVRYVTPSGGYRRYYFRVRYLKNEACTVDEMERVFLNNKVGTVHPTSVCLYGYSNGNKGGGVAPAATKLLKGACAWLRAVPVLVEGCGVGVWSLPLSAASSSFVMPAVASAADAVTRWVPGGISTCIFRCCRLHRRG